MGKDKKQKFIAKAKQGLVSWEDAPEEVKRQADRYNYDIGKHRKEKAMKRDKASKKEMKREIKNYENNNEEE